MGTYSDKFGVDYVVNDNYYVDILNRSIYNSRKFIIVSLNFHLQELQIKYSKLS